MSRKVIAILGVVPLLVFAGCSPTTAPATVESECRVFKDPGFPVRGARVKDQRWISNTQETGIQVCGWPRPKPEADQTPSEVPATG
jgi:hypothetical protein